MTKEQAEAFLRDLTELTRKHGIVVSAWGYEVEGLQLEARREDELEFEYTLKYPGDAESPAPDFRWRKP